MALRTKKKVSNGTSSRNEHIAATVAKKAHMYIPRFNYSDDCGFEPRMETFAQCGNIAWGY